MRTIVHTVLIVLSIALLTCRKVYGQDEIFRFNEETLSAIVDKIDEFDHTTPFLNARSPVFVANLLSDSVAYSDIQKRVARDSTYKGSFNPSNILNQNTRKIDIYRVGAMNCPVTDHILLIKGKEMTFINMHKCYSEVIKEVMRYFEKNKDVDKRLMPLYIHRITLLFLRNHWGDELGPWYDWFHERDSISKEYYPFQYPYTYK